MERKCLLSSWACNDLLFFQIKHTELTTLYKSHESYIWSMRTFNTHTHSRTLTVHAETGYVWWKQAHCCPSSTSRRWSEIGKKRKRRAYVLDTAGTVENLWWLWLFGFFFLVWFCFLVMSYPTSFAEMLPRRMRSLLPHWHHRIWVFTHSCNQPVLHFSFPLVSMLLELPLFPYLHESL